MRRNTTDMGGNASLALAACIYAGLCLLAYFNGVPQGVAADTGVCLPPPQSWGMPAPVSLAANIAITILSAIWLIALNRRFYFIPSTSVLYASVMLLTAAANPRLDTALNASTLLLAANVTSLGLIFGQYGRTKVDPAAIFLVGTIFSFGSMVHYSFIFFIAVYACSAAILKSFHGREFIALLLGVAAPYWIVLGTGLVPVSSLRVPVIEGVWQATVPGAEMLWIIISVAVTAFFGLMAALRNAVALFSASTATRAFNYALTLPAAACLMLALVDWENFMVYYMPLCMFTGLEAGYLCARERRSPGAVVYWSVAAIYIFFTIMSLNNV